MPSIDTELIISLLVIALIGVLLSLLLIYIHRKYLPNKKAAKKLLKNKWFWTAASVLFAFIVYAFFLSPGNIQYYKKWMECGQAPLETHSGQMFGGGVPYYDESNKLVPFRFTMDFDRQYYYCTEHSAELEGYSANPNQFEFDYATPSEKHDYYLKHGHYN